jgi:hypothetical protein
MGNILNEMLLAEVQFDSKGNYIRYIDFYMGKFNHRIDYKRSFLGNISSSSMIYLDSAGFELWSQSKRDYKSGKFKLKIQDRDYNNEKVPSSESFLQIRKYDLKGREKYVFNQTHFEDGVQTHHSESILKSEFYKKDLIGIRTFLYQDTITGIDTIYFNNKWQVLKTKSYNLQEGKFIHFHTSLMNYDIYGNRTMYKSVNPTPYSYSECLDGNEFELIYEYSENNLIQNVTYKYDNKTYLVKFEYE